MAALLCAVLVQFSAYGGITESQAQVLAAFFGVTGAAVVSKSDDPRTILGAFVIPAACAYYYLRKYTPAFNLGQARVIINTVSKDQFASSYKESFASMEKEKLLHKVSKLYQDNIDIEHYPLIIARNKLNNLKIPLADARELIDYAKNDAEKDGILKQLYLDLDAQHDKYQDNITEAIARITTTEPEYTEILTKYNALKTTNTQLQIDQQNANSKAKIADAKKDGAQAEIKKAEALKSYTLLQWVDFWLGWLFRSHKDK